MIIKRNRLGIEYTLHEDSNNVTTIKLGKTLVQVNCPIREVSARWDLWLKGEYIQSAFENLTPDEREFIMTGITKDAWEDMFKEME